MSTLLFPSCDNARAHLVLVCILQDMLKVLPIFYEITPPAPERRIPLVARYSPSFEAKVRVDRNNEGVDISAEMNVKQIDTTR